jgi:iron complex transport system permease protein
MGGWSRQLAGERRRYPPAAPQIVGPVSPLTRTVGVLALLAALALLVQPAFPLGRVVGPAGNRALTAGTPVGGAHNLWDVVVALPAVAMLGVAGAMLVRVRLPRLGLATVIAAGALAVGQTLRVLSLLRSGERLGLDLPVPEGQVRVFQYSPGPGLWLWLAGYLLLVAAGVLAVLAYRGTDMDDDGSFDPLRPLFGGLSLVAALLVLGGIVLAAADPTGGDPGVSLTVPQRLELDRVGLTLPAPDLPLSASSAAAMTLVDRPALDLAGGLLLALAAAVAVVLASTLHPRLAAVGMYLGLAGLLGSAALSSWLLILRSTVLSVGAGAILLASAALMVAGLALAGWRTTPPAGTGLPGEPR